MSNAPDLTQDENQIITQSLALARSDKTRTTSQTNNVPLAAKHSGWIRVQDGDFNVRKFSKISKNNDESSGSVKATTIIHASAEEVLAFFWSYCSNARLKEHRKNNGNLLRKNLGPKIISGRTEQVVFRKILPPPFFLRESNINIVWSDRKERASESIIGGTNDDLVLAFTPADVFYSDLHEERSHHSKISKTATTLRRKNKNKKIKNNPLAKVAPEGKQLGKNRETPKKGHTQLKITGVCVLKRLARAVCEVTFVTQIVDGGGIPISLPNAKMEGTLSLVKFAKTTFERNGLAVDEELGVSFIEKIPSTIDLITDEQHAFVEQQQDLARTNDETLWVKNEFQSSDFVNVYSKRSKNSEITWVKAEQATLNASPEEVLAWLWNYCGTGRLIAVKDLHKNPREKIKSVAANQQVYFTIKHLPWPLSARQFFFECVWVKQDER